MTEELRKAFDELLVGEPPLRTSAGDAVAGGRRLQGRQRALWTGLGTALAVAAVVVGPQLISPAGGPQSPAALQSSPTDGPSPTGSASTGPTPTVAPRAELALKHEQFCPLTNPGQLPQTDGSVLPDPDRAAAAVIAAAPQIAPGMTFIKRLAARVDQAPKFQGNPVLALIFDAGDDAGFGSINLQILPETGAEPAVRAQLGLNVSECVDVSRHDFADGSVAVYYPYGPPAQEQVVMHLWYYATGGFTMNIGMFPDGWSPNEDPETPPPPPPLPVRTTMPLTIGQVMEIADVVAHS